MKLELNIDNVHIVTFQIKDPSQATLGHIVGIVNNNLASEFRPRSYQDKHNQNFTLEQLQYTLAHLDNLNITQNQVMLKAKTLEQGQDDLSKVLLSTMPDSSILTMESITLSTLASKLIIDGLCEGKETESCPSVKQKTTLPPYFTGLTHLTLPHGMGITSDVANDNRFNFLLQLITNTPTLKSFEIKNAYFSTKHAKKLAIELKGKPIEYLGLPNGHIGIEGATDLIKNLKALKMLNLHYQRDEFYSLTAMYMLVDELKRHTSLERVIFTRFPYINFHLPLIKNMMLTNKKIVSFQVTPENNPIAGEIKFLEEENTRNKLVRTIFDCTSFMIKFPLDLVLLMCDYLVDRLRYNGIQAPLSIVYGRHPNYHDLECRFFPSSVSSQVTPDLVLQKSLPELVKKYNFENTTLQAILSGVAKYRFNAEVNVETIFELKNNPEIKCMEGWIAEKSGIAERFRRLFTFDIVRFARQLSRIEIMIREVMNDELENGHLPQLPHSEFDQLNRDFQTLLDSDESKNLAQTNPEHNQFLSRAQLDRKVHSDQRLSGINKTIKGIMSKYKLCSDKWQLPEIETMIRRVLGDEKYNSAAFENELVRKDIEKEICKCLSHQYHSVVTPAPVTAEIEIISGHLVLQGIDAYQLWLLMENLTTHIKNQGVYPESLKKLLTSKEFNQQKSENQNSISSSFATLGLVTSSSSSSSSSSTSSSTANSSTSWFPSFKKLWQ